MMMYARFANLIPADSFTLAGCARRTALVSQKLPPNYSNILWLQVNYPTTFAGCWSSTPDPVDFRNLQQINLYADMNMFYDAHYGSEGGGFGSRLDSLDIPEI